MNKTILWLEDREETIEGANKLLIQNGIKCIFFSTLDSFAEKLELMVQKNTPPMAIIVDIMLYGVKDLSCIIKNPPATDGGSEAGWVILERYLRTSGKDSVLEQDSADKTQKIIETRDEFKKIPVLIYSARELTKKAKAKLTKNQNKPIDFIEKKAGWDIEFRKWLRTI